MHFKSIYENFITFILYLFILNKKKHIQKTYLYIILYKEIPVLMDNLTNISPLNRYFTIHTSFIIF